MYTILISLAQVYNVWKTSPNCRLNKMYESIFALETCLVLKGFLEFLIVTHTRGEEVEKSKSYIK